MTIDAPNERIRSADGTSIAFERSGAGPALIMIDPAGGYRHFDNLRGLGKLLVSDFTVYTYDRRGRGDSTDTLPYSVGREVEDLAALVTEAGGSAHLYGFSSGALLACQAAASGLPVGKLALLEPPFNTAGDQVDTGLRARIAELVEADRRSEATDHWLHAIGVPPEMIAEMEPVKPALDAVAHTLVYDSLIVEQTDLDIVRSVTRPTLVLDSEASDGQLRSAADQLEKALPDGRRRSLAGEWHGVADEDLAPVLTDFFRR